MKRMSNVYDKVVDYLASVSRLINDKWFGGVASESLSGRSYRLRNESVGWRISRALINILFFWQKDHCKAVHEGEVKRGVV